MGALPIWGYCTDRTTYEIGTTAVQSVRRFAEPRIEPEIMFGLGKAPALNMDKAALLDCIDWSQAFEADGPAIVDCVVAADESPNVPHLDLERMG